MKPSVSPTTLALAAVVTVLPRLAVAAPVTFAFTGSVTGASSFNPSVLTDFPIGTAASFNVTFDQGNLTPTLPVTSLEVPGVSGPLSLDGNTWQLDEGGIRSYAYDFSGAVLWYGLQLTGTGPGISNDGQFFGLFLWLTPHLQLAPVDQPIMAGFGYTTQSGGFTITNYSYAALDGTFVQTAQVPEPTSLVLVGLGLAGLPVARRRRATPR